MTRMKGRLTLTLVLRNKLLPRTEKVVNATVDIDGTRIPRTTNAKGRLSLNMPADGDHTVSITPMYTSTDPVGPAIAESTNPPDRMFRSLDVSLTITKGKVSNATAHTPGAVKKSGSQVTVDLQPIWMQSPFESARPGATPTPTLIVIHHTGGPKIGPALRTFLSGGKKVSAHYVIDTGGQIVKMVRDSRIANQAGTSRWGGVKGVNAISIGIEIVNQTGPYTEDQYEALLKLLDQLLTAYPSILWHRIVGHSDVATGPTDKQQLGRKAGDPGQDFEWERLERRGWGLVPGIGPIPGDIYGGFFSHYPSESLRLNDNDALHRYGGKPCPIIPVAGTNSPIQELQNDLATIGYSLGSANGNYNKRTERAVKMFQLHFLRSREPNGRLDADTADMIKHVLLNPANLRK